MNESTEEKILKTVKKGAKRLYPFSIIKCLQRSWIIFRRESLYFMTYGFMLLIILFISVWLPWWICLILGVCMGPISVGFYNAVSRIERRKKVDCELFLSGFYCNKNIWFTSMLIILLVFIFSFLIFPAIYLLVSLSFSVFFVQYKRKKIFESFLCSNKLVLKNWFYFFLFFIVIIGMNVLGLLCLGIGLIVSIPVSFIAYHEVFYKLTFQKENK